MDDLWLEPQIEPIRALVEAGDDAGEAIEALIDDGAARGAPELLRAHCALGALFLEELDDEQAVAHHASAVEAAREVESWSAGDVELLLGAHTQLLLLLDRGLEPASPEVLDEAIACIDDLAAAHRNEAVDAATATLRAVLGRLLAGAGRAAEAESQERAVIAHHRGREPRDEDALVRAELRLSRLLVHRGEPEGEALLRAIIARAGDPPDSLIEAHAVLTGLLEDRGSAEAAVIAARGAALADRYCEEPLAMDVLRLLLGPWGDDDGAVQWPTTGAVLQASHGRISNPLPLDEHGHPTPDGVRSEVVFGPLRPFACSCGKYAGLRSWGTICEVCRVAVEAVTPRRSRFGHIALATPAVHPAATTTIARLLDLDEAEVVAIRDFESQLAGDTGPAALESALRNLYLEGEAERLAEATAQCRVRGRVQLIADSAATVAAFLRDDLRPEALILHALPVLPPGLDPAVHPALRAKGRSEIEQACARVLTTNAEIEQLAAAGAPLETASVALQREIDALIGLFSSLPAPSPSTVDPGALSATT